MCKAWATLSTLLKKNGVIITLFYGVMQLCNFDILKGVISDTYQVSAFSMGEVLKQYQMLLLGLAYVNFGTYFEVSFSKTPLEKN